MILKIIKEAPSITGKKKYPVGREMIVTDIQYGQMLIDEGYAKKLDGRSSFMKEVQKARKENTERNLKKSN